MKLIEVALPLPLPRTFTYRVNASAVVAEGTRVLVPFGPRRLVGWVAGPADGGAVPALADGDGGAERIRDVARVLDPVPSVPPELLRLCRWIADYYVAPLGQVLRAALPAVLSSGARPDPAVKRRSVLRLTRALPSLQLRDELFARAPRQRECYELLEASGGEADVAHLVERCGYSASVLKGLVARGVAEVVAEEVERDPFLDATASPPAELVPSPAQATVIARLTAAQDEPDRRPFLLRGVTGSGKTLVYIELLKAVLARGGGGIVLVPEIALTPQAVARFRAHFGDAVAVLHSGLSDGERYDAWRALHRGEKRVAVGARSAVFAPVRRLGAIVVDEEHEGTYKQADAPRYHARDVAIMRAAMAGAVCVLGSATPALESWHNARSGRFELLELPARIGDRPLPPVRLIDLREERQRLAATAERTPAARGGPGSRRSGARPEIVLSPPLTTAIEDRLRRGEQSILLLNRRGFASFVQCRSCGAVWHCGNCNVSLTYHQSRRRLVCHHCFHHEPAPASCDACGGGDLSFRGVGTEQVERAVAEAFPAARVARMDVDTTSGKWSHQRILERVGRGEVDILLGTQMIAKGLDFPAVTLVGVIHADVGLHLPDFRASERTFQLLTQVAGRAGRGGAGGEVLIQTLLPQHPVLRAVIGHDYTGFAALELASRASPGYPPLVRLANVVVSGTEEGAVERAAAAAVDWMRARVGETGAGVGAGAVAITGPAPCPIDRVRGRWRWHFLLRSPGARALGDALTKLHLDFPVPRGRADLRLAIDRDPTALL